MKYNIGYRVYDRMFRVADEGYVVVNIKKPRMTSYGPMHEPSQAVLKADQHLRKHNRHYVGGMARVLTVNP